MGWLQAAGPFGLLLFALSGSVTAACAQSADPAAADADATPEADLPRPDATFAVFARALDARRDDLIAIRRDIHAHPEPSGQEARTAGVVAYQLRDLGFDVTTGVGGHGVVGVLRGAAPAAANGPVLAFRADMDAVRDGADDPMEFRSTVPGVNHICGHDVHTTVGLALAVGFSAIREELPGSVMLIFQPAEETASGANAMLADGVFGSRGPAARAPDAIFAYHTAPLEVGEIMTRPGALLPGRDQVRIGVRGDGDLASVARSVRDAVAALATEGSTEPSRPVTVDFVAVRGLRTTPAPDGSWSVGATLTTSRVAVSRRAYSELERTLTELERPGVEIDLAFRERFIAGIDNDPGLVERANAVSRRVLGDDAVRAPSSQSTVFSEDFGSFQRHVPGVMYFLGVSNSDRGWVGMPHTPTYVADEEAIFVGAEVMAAVFLDLFRR